MGERTDAKALYERASTGDDAALAQLLTLVESVPRDVAAVVWSEPRRSHVIGITGAPGVGKSTLTSALIRELHSRRRRVGVLAIDPSSPRTGGAILGDRIRMSEHHVDRDVFIRSFATRGSSGGLSAAVPLAIRVLESVGFGYVVVETVGVGQAELDIATYADSVVLVLNPRWGDGVQANKAGILEIADVLVVNKADCVGAADTVADLRAAQSLGAATELTPSIAVPIVETVATEPRGVDTLAAAIDRHGALLSAGDGSALTDRRTRRVADHLVAVVRFNLEQSLAGMAESASFRRAVADVASGRHDPWILADRLIPTYTADRA